MTMLRKIAFASTIIIFWLLLTKATFAAPVQDNVNGSWTDSYSDATGFGSLSNTTVSSGVLRLSGAPGSYPASGTARTVSIIPVSVVRWGQITFDSATPPNTSFKIQVIDEGNHLFPDSKLAGNSVGFISSPIDISSLLVTYSSYSDSAKHSRIRFLISLYSNDNTVTPTLDNFSFTWTAKNGPFNTPILADTYWPIPGGSEKRSGKLKTTLEFNYPVVRWAKDMGYLGSTYVSIGFDNELILKSQGTLISNPPVNVSDGRFIRVNRNNGEEIASTDWNGYTYSDIDFVISQDRTLYFADIFNDVMAAYDTNTWQLKWSYPFYRGHSFGSVIFSSAGKIITGRCTSGNKNFTIYAFNPDGTVAWTSLIPDTSGPDYYAGSDFALDKNGNLIFGTSALNPSTYRYTNNGKVYSVSSSDGSINWSYPTGDVRQVAVADTGEIITGNTDGSFRTFFKERKVFALDTSGNLIWEKSLGFTDRYVSNLVISDNDIILIMVYPYGDEEGNYLWENFNKSDLIKLDLNDGDILYTQSFESQITSFKYSIIEKDGKSFFHTTNRELSPPYRYSNSLIYHLDDNGNTLFKFNHGGYTFVNFSLTFDEEGNLYYVLSDTSNPSGYAQTSKLVSLAPLEITVETDKSNYEQGEEVNFSIVSNLSDVNPLINGVNSMQIVVGDEKVNLSFSGTNEEGNYIWTGSYFVPQDESDGVKDFRLEIAEAGLETSNALSFDLTADLSNNTGIVIDGNFQVGELEPTGSNLYPIIIIYLVFLVFLIRNTLLKFIPK